MEFVAGLLSSLATIFTGAGVISYSPHSSLVEPECPKDLL
jgi:hypothetical protein